MNLYIWLGIAVCISQSAMFSGLNLALFSVSRLRLEVDAAHSPQKELATGHDPQPQHPGPADLPGSTPTS
jgi:CBS domain containing-hemolysin-like protein